MRVLRAIACFDCGKVERGDSYEFSSWFGPLSALGHDVEVFDTFGSSGPVPGADGTGARRPGIGVPAGPRPLHAHRGRDLDGDRRRVAADVLGGEGYFLPSSVCIYRDMEPGEPGMTEAGAYPAMPDNEYGWEKLYAERVAEAYGRRYGMAVRIARFQNCHGPEGTWRGGREKAPAAMCRKVAEVPDGGTIEVWGDGVRHPLLHLRGGHGRRHRAADPDLEGAVNIGSPEYVSVDELVDVVEQAAGKTVHNRYIDGPVGVQSRNFSNGRIEWSGWRARFSLLDGIARTYPWVEQQMAQAAARTAA